MERTTLRNTRHQKSASAAQRTLNPSQLSETLPKGSDESLPFRIACGIPSEHADTPSPLVLLRARAASGHVAAAPPSSVMNLRRIHSIHLVGAREHRRRHVEPERFRGSA